MAEPHIRIGTSGWTYSTWRGRFYPAGLPRAQELTYLSERLDALELNGTFYRLQRPATYASWGERVTGGFTFAVKGWKQVTHVRRLRDAQPDVAAFLASGVLDLGSHLGTILWQLPPSLTFDPDVLEEFLGSLPRTVQEARAVAASAVVSPEADQHDPDDDAVQPALLDLPTVKRLPEPGVAIPLRYALEPRNASFADPRAREILRRHGVAMVVSDTAGRHPMFDDVTTDFVYVRLHGSPRLYFSAYSEEVLAAWAGRIRTWRGDGLGVDVFFDNTGAGHAPANALALARMVDVAAEARGDPGSTHTPVRGENAPVTTTVWPRDAPA